MSLESIFEFLQTGPMNPPAAAVRNSKVTYVVVNNLGSIVMLYDNRRVVRKANVINHTDIRITTPLDYLTRFREQPVVSMSIMGKDANASITFMYCHREMGKVGSHCRSVLLLGPVKLVFANPNTETEQAQVDHANLCDCGHLCFTRSATYMLGPGDKIILSTGDLKVRASAEEHMIYLNKRQLVSGSVVYEPALEQDKVKMQSFVQSLPDDTDPAISS